MTSGLSNSAKAKVREQAAQGLVGRAELLEECSESAYHSEGTCTFYGTANSNQMLMEAMGLHVPGTAFINPGQALRQELTHEAARTVLAPGCTPIGKLVDERAIVNAMAALLATGRLHQPPDPLGGRWRAPQAFPSIGTTSPSFRTWCRCWRASIPTAARREPVQFQAAGGPGYVLRELLDAA